MAKKISIATQVEKLELEGEGSNTDTLQDYFLQCLANYSSGYSFKELYTELTKKDRLELIHNAVFRIDKEPDCTLFKYIEKLLQFEGELR